MDFKVFLSKVISHAHVERVHLLGKTVGRMLRGEIGDAAAIHERPMDEVVADHAFARSRGSFK